jgi:hypothetical protein
MSLRKTVLYQLLITIFLLVILEAIARVAYTLHVDTREEWFIYTSDMGWDRRPNFNGLDLCGTHRVFDSQGLVSIDATQLQNGGSKQRRVMFLGDSNTYGYCLPTESTFVEVADRLLPQFDLINLGVPGYTSYQGYKQLLKYGELIKPDSIFISFNYNDRRYVTGDDIDSRLRQDGNAAHSGVQLFVSFGHSFRREDSHHKVSRQFKGCGESGQAQAQS